MIKLCINLWALLMTASLSSPVFAEVTLKHDPFARPVLAKAALESDQTDITVNDDGLFDPQLIAVMVAGKHSLININGYILKVGEEIDGHRLVNVKDRQAVFKKGRQRIVIDMDMTVVRENKERGEK